MTREERDEQIWLLAAGALDDAEAESLRRLLSQGDPADAAAYAEALATAAHLPLALDQIPPPDSAREKLLARVAGSPKNIQPNQNSRYVLPWFAGLAAAAAIVLGLLSYHLTNQRDEANAKEAKWHARLTSAQRLASVATARELQMIQLTAGVPKSIARGRVLWDKDRNQWNVIVFDMTPPPDGREFELWFITPDQKKIPAGTFHVNAKGDGSMIAKVPADLKNIAVAAITDEPIGGVPQPTGQVQLAGKVE